MKANPCAYTPDVAARPRLRGVMSGGGDMGEDDFKTLHEWGAKLLRFQMVRDWHAVNANRDIDEYEAIGDAGMAQLSILSIRTP